jgi:hypothetical protein
MCKFILSALPRGADPMRLETAIPMDLRRRLIRLGPDEYAAADQVGVEEVENPFVTSQVPGDDRLVRLTRIHCDCWSELGCYWKSLKNWDWDTIYEFLR